MSYDFSNSTEWLSYFELHHHIDDSLYFEVKIQENVYGMRSSQFFDFHVKKCLEITSITILLLEKSKNVFKIFPRPLLQNAKIV